MTAATSSPGIESILDALPAHILCCDSRLRLRYANAAAQRTLSVPRRDARGQLLGEVMPLQRADGDALRVALSGRRQDCRRLTRLQDRRSEYRRYRILPVPTSPAGGVLILSVADRDPGPQLSESRRLMQECLRALRALRALRVPQSGTDGAPTLGRSDAVRHTDAAIRTVREHLAALVRSSDDAQPADVAAGSGASARVVREVFDVLPAAVIARSSEGRVVANRLARTWYPDRLPASGAEAVAMRAESPVEVDEYEFAARATSGRVTVVRTPDPGVTDGGEFSDAAAAARHRDLLVTRLDATGQGLFAAGLIGATRAGVGTPELHRAIAALEQAIDDLRAALTEAQLSVSC